MNFEVKLPNFEGPLDLLLYLIKKEKINIYDIPIAEITNQYLMYINHLDTINVDSISEFLVMAATLLEIKSKMLLPKLQEEEEDPRQELVERLREYQKYKEVAIYLKENHPYRESYKRAFELRNFESNFVVKVDVNKLIETYRNILSKKETTSSDNDKRLQEITKKQTISILKVIKQVLEYIKQKGVAYFSHLIKGISKDEIVYRFLAILELCKLGHISLHQQKVFDDIKITKR
ncbi:chromosome segregation protein ScpA [Caldicellulosiruptor changbaiensis]|uniref:Segregation and condensation protein A n=1 Tax=Caldicellulosiruptor changbaiensis TaxID=1222016 RepID=A0A3T0D7I6_9FIRM|nr:MULTISPECIES: segregation/condensation protein A [Caldicellulosiruptor]AZT90984.1 chromosome segregation protein ScpA [Caldicellulosiruptor changbaiensis]